jgi:hypothetical protein
VHQHDRGQRSGRGVMGGHGRASGGDSATRRHGQPGHGGEASDDPAPAEQAAASWIDLLHGISCGAQGLASGTSRLVNDNALRPAIRADARAENSDNAD